MIILVTQILEIVNLRLMKLPLSSDEEGKHKYTWSRFCLVSGDKPALPNRLTAVGSPIFPHHLKTETNTAAFVILVK